MILIMVMLVSGIVAFRQMVIHMILTKHYHIRKASPFVAVYDGPIESLY